MTTLPPRLGRTPVAGAVRRQANEKGEPRCHGLSLGNTGAGNESRTRDLNLGKVALYQLSYSRVGQPSIIAESSVRQNGTIPRDASASAQMTVAIALAT